MQESDQESTPKPTTPEQSQGVTDLEAELERLDKALVSRGHVLSRERAKSLIKKGAVTVDGVVVTEPSFIVEREALLALTEADIPWVSRSGVKLAHALALWQFDPKDHVCIDIGASTGGFTEVLLSLGAKKVYAIDVGHGQLHEKLRGDARVINMEGMHVNMMDGSEIGEQADLVVVDVSFISLTKVLGRAKMFMKPGGRIIALVKPQFEVGREAINKGIVKDKKLRAKALEAVKQFAATAGLAVKNETVSPIKGGDGNEEYLLLLASTKD